MSAYSSSVPKDDIAHMCKGPQLEEAFGVYPTTFLFAHGLGGRGTNAEWYAKEAWHIIKCPYHTFNFPDVGEKKGQIKYNKVNIGQDIDIQAFVDEYNHVLAHLQGDPKEGIVVVGDSRGAITALNAAGKYQLSKLRALVAIAPADTTYNVVDHLLSRYKLDWEPLVYAVHGIMSAWWYEPHDSTGITPLDAVKNIDKELPILLVHAKDDDFISVNSSRMLYYELLLTGHNPDKLFLLEIPHGKHGKYNFSDAESAKILEAGVHAFYSWFHTPYSAKLADEGEKYLACSQPSLEEIKALLSKEATDYLERAQKRKTFKEEL